MIINGYFSHKSPTYGTPFQMMKSLGITYQNAGENIASGYSRPNTVVQAWMDSPGHRTNILKPEYTHIGVGYFYTHGGNFHHFWTQEFIGKWGMVSQKHPTPFKDKGKIISDTQSKTLYKKTAGIYTSSHKKKL